MKAEKIYFYKIKKDVTVFSETCFPILKSKKFTMPEYFTLNSTVIRNLVSG